MLTKPGISITPVIIALGVGGLGVALAFQNTLSNLFTGMHILVERSMRVGAFVRLERGQEGHVEDITWGTTRIRMLPKNIIVTPNNKLHPPHDSLSKGGKGMAEVKEPFEFKQCISILKSTGKRAKNLRELRDMIAVVSDESIFHHTYQYFLKGHILEYTNDFAHWVGESLEERALSEQLSNIDPYAFKEIDNLRKELINVIEAYLKEFPEPREAMAGDEFYFNETITLIFPVGIRAKNLAEFLIAVKYIDAAAIYYHFYEARIRLGVDDFSKWLEDSLNKKEVAEKIRSIDPFMHSIEGIREHIIEIIERDVRTGMETIEP